MRSIQELAFYNRKPGRLPGLNFWLTLEGEGIRREFKNQDLTPFFPEDKGFPIFSDHSQVEQLLEPLPKEHGLQFPFRWTRTFTDGTYTDNENKKLNRLWRDVI